MLAINHTNSQDNHSQLPRLTSANTDTRVIEMWLSDKAQSTRRVYRGNLNQFFSQFPVTLTEINLDVLYDYRDWLSTQGLSQTTIKNKLNTLKSLLTFAHKIGYLAFNPGLVLSIKKGHDLKHERILQSKDIKALLDVIENPRDSIAVQCLFYLGLRVSELLALTRRSFYQADKGWNVSVIGKGDKQRVLSVPKVLLANLELWLAEAQPEHLLVASHRGYNKPLQRSRFHLLIKSYAKKAGVDYNLSCHWLRHSHATLALQNGCDLPTLSKNLGHSNIKTTSVYLHSLQEKSSGDFLPDLS